MNETEGIVRTSFSRSVSRVSLKTSAALVTAAKGDASSTVAEETTPMVCACAYYANHKRYMIIIILRSMILS